MPVYSAMMPDRYAHMTPDQRRASDAMRREFTATWTEQSGDPDKFMDAVRRRAMVRIGEVGPAAYADEIEDRFGTDRN